MANQAGIDNFLNPEAMLTPGAAGALTMMITNALALNFDTHRALTGLIISGLFGALVFVAARSVLQKSVYYVLNTLIIFCVALGANTVGVDKVASIAFAPTAFAQPTRNSAADNRVSALRDLLATEEKLQALKSQNADPALIKKIEQERVDRLQALQILEAPSQTSKGGTFFQPWIK
jgi:hypothetical protein